MVLLFDRDADPLCLTDVSDDPGYANDRMRLVELMEARMADLNDGLHRCTWYRDNWMYKEYSIQAGARGPFGPLPPIEPLRT
jgi:hypothetical protein